MEFGSFEQALTVCMTAKEGSPEQVASMLYCLENAPPELREMLQARFAGFHQHGSNCCCDGHVKK